MYFCIWQPRGASDHQKDFKNENLRQFAIGAVYHFSFWDGLGEKLWLVKVGKQATSDEHTHWIRSSNKLQLLLTAVCYCYNGKIQRTLPFLSQPVYEVWRVITFHLIHPTKKSGTWLRSQIRWSFHFCNRFNDQRHPLAAWSKSV